MINFHFKLVSSFFLTLDELLRIAIWSINES